MTGLMVAGVILSYVIVARTAERLNLNFFTLLLSLGLVALLLLALFGEPRT